MDKDHLISRRSFIKTASLIGSGFAIGFNFLQAKRELNSEFSPNMYINVLSDDTVILSVSKAEMGQGIWTSLPMLIAEEMEVDWGKVKVQQISKDNFIGTGGSMSISGYGWEKMREAGAVAKQVLVESAALKWKVSPVECVAKNSVVYHQKTRRSTSFGSLVDEASKVKIPKSVRLKKPSEFNLLGKDMLRTDSKIKVDGTALFSMDKNLSGMLYAMVERPKYFGAKYKNSNLEHIKNQNGIIDVFRIPSGVAIVGEKYWSVVKARKLLKVNWEKKSNPVYADSKIYRSHLDKLSNGKSSKVRKDGSPSKIFKNAKDIVKAQYYLPFQTHAAMEPCNCVVNVSDNACEIWTGTQNPDNAITRASKVTGIPEKNIKLNLTFLGGGFGRKSFNDWIEDGVRISKHLKKPIKLINSREDDTKYGFARPSSKHNMSAVVSRKSIKAWKHIVVSPDPLTGNAANQYGASIPILKWATSIGIVKNKIRNYLVTDGAAHILYDFENVSVKASPFETDIPLGFWRAVFHSQNAFANECFIDELAHKSDIDPIQLRLSHLKNNIRPIKVIQKVADESNWGSVLPKDHFQGFAYHYSFGTHVAQVAELSIVDNQIKLHKVFCSVDCGQTVNPMTIRAQIQGSIIFGMGATLNSEMTVKNGRVNESNFDDYPVVRFDESPQIKVFILKNNEKPGGVGEPGLPPIAPAIANAVFAASGKRIRKLPIISKDLS
ncbi:MAG: aldehyde oxidase [Candidatus Neomarinimicrobiota bacterium]|nr:MAG: aldehyde oxidase [Candidatus Neomarinimicrobiota bacterium]